MKRRAVYCFKTFDGTSCPPLSAFLFVAAVQCKLFFGSSFAKDST